MALHQFSTNRAERANAEIIFVAMLTAAIVGVGAAGVAISTQITAETSERMDQPEFQTADNSNLAVEYADGPLLNSNDDTAAVVLYDGETEHVVYNSTSEGDLQPGDMLINRSEAVELGIEPDSTVEIVLRWDNGDSEVVSEIYLPDEDLLGNTFAAANGSMDVTADRLNATAEL